MYVQCNTNTVTRVSCEHGADLLVRSCCDKDDAVLSRRDVGTILVVGRTLWVWCKQSHYCDTAGFNYHHRQQKTRHVSSPFLTTGPATDLASPGDIKLLNRSGLFCCGLL